MIGKQFSTASISATADYLRRGHQNVPESERVAWSTERNLPPGEDIGETAEMMDNTASLRPRVEKPGYHFSVSFDPGDQPTREQMEAIADRVLSDLGLAEHQAIIVAHKDREHPHFHVLANRIHPDTLQPWDRWQDRVKMQRSLRQLEREFSLREVPGRLHQLEGQEPPQAYQVPSWQIHRHRATGRMPFQDALKAGQVHREIARASTWRELEQRLATLGLELKKVGRGIRISDGHESIKASAVDRAASLGRLEKRFDQTYADHLAGGGARPDPQPARELVERLRTDLQVWAQLQEQIDAEKEAFAPQLAERERLIQQREQLPNYERPHQLQAKLDRIRPDQKLTEHVDKIYSKPAEARRAIETSIREHGVPATLEVFRDRPEAFGKLPILGRGKARETAAAISDEVDRQVTSRATIEAVQRQAEAINKRISPITLAEREVGKAPKTAQYRLQKGLRSQLRQMVKQRIPGGVYLTLAAAAVGSPQVVPAKLAQRLALNMRKAYGDPERERRRERPDLSMGF